MQAHRLEATIEHDGTLMLSDLPFQPGESVEVIILPKRPVVPKMHSLRNMPVGYIDPTEPVAEDMWEALG